MIGYFLSFGAGVVATIAIESAVCWIWLHHIDGWRQ
jgi:hypothetical protein